jgi:hypothetical protein
MDLRVRLAIALVPALADQAVFPNHHRADQGVGFDVTPTVLGKGKSALHPGLIRFHHELHSNQSTASQLMHGCHTQEGSYPRHTKM